MARRLSAKEARASFSEVLGSVYYRNEPVIIEKNGKPVAVVISPQMYEVIERELDKAWEVQERVWARNAGKDPDEVAANVAAALQEVRADRMEGARP